MTDPWSDAENDLIVADYFSMLASDVAGRAYNKAAHRRALRQKIKRSDGSVEFKHQNISAVLKALGEDWIPGYKPAFNFQMSLVEAVMRWMDGHADWLDPNTRASSVPAQGFAEATPLRVGPAPTLRNTPDPAELEQTLAIARTFDVADRDERNRALGKAGEACVLAHEKSVLQAAGRSDLAHSVTWISEDQGDGAGYDIASYTPEGRSRLIEVKTTNGWERTPFHISRNELRVANENRKIWVLLRLHSFARAPQAFEIRPPLDAHVDLTPTSFSASFR